MEKPKIIWEIKDAGHIKMAELPAKMIERLVDYANWAEIQIKYLSNPTKIAAFIMREQVIDKITDCKRKLKQSQDYNDYDGISQCEHTISVLQELLPQ